MHACGAQAVMIDFGVKSIDKVKDDVLDERLVSCKNCISKLLGCGGLWTRAGQECYGLVNVTEEKLDLAIKNLQRVFQGGIAWKKMSTEAESQDKSLGTPIIKFIEQTGELVQRQGHGVWRRLRLSWTWNMIGS